MITLNTSLPSYISSSKIDIGFAAILFQAAIVPVSVTGK